MKTIAVQDRMVGAGSVARSGGAMRGRAADEARDLHARERCVHGIGQQLHNGFGLTWVSADWILTTTTASSANGVEFWSFLPFVGDEGYTTYASWTCRRRK